jgi:hypothetical protein
MRTLPPSVPSVPRTGSQAKMENKKKNAATVKTNN